MRTPGFRHSAETLAKMRAAAKGRVLSLETRAKLSAVRKGRERTPEQVAATVLALTTHGRGPRDCRSTGQTTTATMNPATVDGRHSRSR